MSYRNSKRSYKESEPQNRKIKNATKIVIDGIKFDSKLEAYMYSLLIDAGIKFEFQKKIVLIDKFKYGKESIREMSLIVDFYLEGKNIIIDTKGYQTQENKNKWKIFKSLFRNDLHIIYLPSNRKKCEEVLHLLKNDIPL